LQVAERSGGLKSRSPWARSFVPFSRRDWRPARRHIGGRAV